MNKKSIITGVIVGGVSVIYSIAFEKLLLSGSNMFVGVIPLAFLIGGMVYVDIMVRKENGGFLSFKEGFVPAATVAVVSTVISSLFSFINLKFIKTKEQLDEMVKIIADNMIQKGLPEAQAYEIAGKSFNSTNVLLLGFGGGIILALVLAAIVSAIISKKKPLV